MSVKKRKLMNVIFDDKKITLEENTITDTYDVIEVLHPRNKKITRSEILKERDVKKKIYNLKEITALELSLIRLSGTPGFVIKIDGCYYYTKVKRSSKFITSYILGDHLCANCSKLSALPDNLGGCSKIRENSTGIEKYDYITTGYESFNTVQDCFVVIKCSHHNPNNKKIARKVSAQINKEALIY